VLALGLHARPADLTRRALVTIAAGTAALVLALAVLVILTGRWVGAPLRRLSAQVDAIAGGDIAVATPSPSPVKEVRNVAAAVRGMAETLGETFERQEQVDAERTFLLSAAAHDLRTPLFALHGYLEALEDGLGNSAEQLRNARAKARQLDRLITSLFAYARAELGDRPLLEAVDLADTVQRIADELDLSAQRQHVTLNVRGDDVPAVLDIEGFERALANVLENAIRHSPRGGAIEITVERDKEGPIVRVSDDGPGIPIDLLPRVFEPLARSHDRSRQGGAGLGLTIAARLLANQRGTIAATNRPGGGATFTIRLAPVSPAAETAPLPQT
jgi:signal transduction histidine kinase